MKRPAAREIALLTFLDWDATAETADALLARHLDEAHLHGRERDLAWELVRGVFRWRGRLDWQLASLVDRPLRDLHAPILWILRDNSSMRPSRATDLPLLGSMVAM